MDTRQRVLDAIREYQDRHGYPPTVRELAGAVGVASTSVVAFHLNNLRDSGAVEWQPGKARPLRVVAP